MTVFFGISGDNFTLEEREGTVPVRFDEGGDSAIAK
jgi:hypothetical protein